MGLRSFSRVASPYRRHAHLHDRCQQMENRKSDRIVRKRYALVLSVYKTDAPDVLCPIRFGSLVSNQNKAELGDRGLIANASFVVNNDA